MSNNIAVNIRQRNGLPVLNNNINVSLAQSIKAQTVKNKAIATRVTTVGTIELDNHGFAVGDTAVLTGVAPFSGSYTVDSVTVDSFNITVANSGATSDSPNVLRTVLWINEYRGGNASPTMYTITQPLTGSGSLAALCPVGTFFLGTVIYNGPQNPQPAFPDVLAVADGTPTLFFTAKNVSFNQAVYATLTLSDMDRALTAVTATASAAHGLKVGDWITVDSSNNALDGTYQVVTVPTDTTFTYTTTTSGTVTDATGTAYLQRTQVTQYEEGMVNQEYLINELYSSVSLSVQQIQWYSPIAAAQALSGAGAITLTQYLTNWTTTGANAGTLANSTIVGQVKKIVLVVDGGDGTLTPTSLSGGTTITFNDANDYVVLQWNGSAWVILENVGCTVA